MAEANKNTDKKQYASIDPIYKKFSTGVIRALGSTEFYEYFMNAMSGAETTIQFSNRRLIKIVDEEWLERIEDALPQFQEIIEGTPSGKSTVHVPRVQMMEEDLIVDAAYAKKFTSDVGRHLAQHAYMVENYDPDSLEVRPNRVQQKQREETLHTYENRAVYTVLESAYYFVRKRHEALFGVMSDELGAKLKVSSDLESATETMHIDTFVHIRKKDGALETDSKNQDVFSRISRLYRILGMFMNAPLSQELSKRNRVKGEFTKTNILKRNPCYKKIMDLWDFLRGYDEIGYDIQVVEQSPQVSEQFQQDIFHNILFNYIVLKGHLEDDDSRQVPKFREKRRTLKPKFVRQIVEELTEDYDLPDVEIRKVLIQELTKEQLMQEEAAERRRLVQEQAQRKKEEAERIRKEKAAEAERIRKEKAAERERIRLEKAAEEARIRQERTRQKIEDARRSKTLKKELTAFTDKLEHRLELRQNASSKEETQKQDFADAAAQVEALEQRRIEAAQRAKRKAQEEQARKLRQQQEAQERALQEQAQRQKQALEEQRRKDLEQLRGCISELELFRAQLDAQRRNRADYLRQLDEQQAQRKEERRAKRAQRAGLH